MKKFYTLALAAAMAVSASAANLYLVGNGEGLAWEPEAPLVIESANGVFSFDLKNCEQFKMSTEIGPWDVFNTGALFADISEESAIGQALPLENNPDPNISLPWFGDWHVEIPENYATITITNLSAKPSGFTKVYIRGAVNDWGAPDDWELKTSDGIVYWFNCEGDHTLPVGEFKIADANWGSINYGGGGEVIPDYSAVEWNYNANNSVIGEEYTGTIKFELSNGPRNPAPVTLYPEIVEWEGFGSGVEESIVAGNEATVYYNLQGIRVENPQNGLFIARQGNKATKVLVK